MLGTVSFLLYTPALLASPTNIFYISGVLTGIIAFACAFALSRGDRTTAKRLTVVQVVVWVFGWGIVTPVFRLAGPLSPGAAVLGWGGAGILAGLLYAPEYSFSVCYCGLTLTYTVAATVLFAYPETTGMAGLLAYHSANLWLKRRGSIALASR